MSKVILINPFEVPEGREDECLKMWEGAAAYMRAQPGFVNTKLHRAAAPGAKFHFINVSEWKSAEDFQAAISTEEFQKLTAGSMEAFPHFPGLYEIIRD
ncbi:MAG: antibiotic biosynthesis monooxygenase [Gammaproteobacteria bacterium]|nr:antibiotic biosynthesis monooxygenase [Gammaproteobacteria bacterium]